MARALPGTSCCIPKHSEAVIPHDDVGYDLNTVSIDREMAKLMANTMHYNASAEILWRAFDQLKRTVSETQ